LPHCRLTRTKAAQALVDWPATDPTSSGDPDFLIIGDLNAYAMEDPVAAIKAVGYTNLTDAYIGASAYSHVFEGQFGYLDHAPTLWWGGECQLCAASDRRDPVASFSSLRTGINDDEPGALDYNDYNQPGLYSADAYRSSDHDPVIVGLELGEETRYWTYLPVVAREYAEP
jgi:predicted extracellular nuclease